ncbi:hypothetical protein [Cytobacillus spongiae]|uniref:hypothetical protein n=1 Tax=Cytobacillus spongiae TaxID=2901381 RepID=UPI003D7AAB89
MLCVDSCPEQAVSINEKVSKATTITLDVYNKTCTDCKKPFKTLHKQEAKCPVCSHKREGYLSSNTC